MGHLIVAICLLFSPQMVFQVPPDWPDWVLQGLQLWALLDAPIALCSVFFAVRFVLERRSSRLCGTLCISLSLYSCLAYTAMTLELWREEAVEQTLAYLLYLPVLLLAYRWFFVDRLYRYDLS